MALLRKRKAIDYAEYDDNETDEDHTIVDDESYEDDPKLKARRAKAKEKEKKRRRTEKKKPVFPNPSYNVWDTLPGEIKNKIYSLLVDEEYGEKRVLNIGAHPTYWYSILGFRQRETYWYSSSDSPKSKWVAWYPMSLFMVSKDIRRESMSLYFGRRKFQLSIRAHKLKLALSLLKRLTSYSEHSFLENWQVRLVETSWDNIVDWSHIANFIFEYTKFDELGESTPSVREEVKRWLLQFGLLSHDHSTAFLTRMDFALKALIEMSVKGRRRGLDRVSLAEDFDDWVRNSRCRRYITLGDYPEYVPSDVLTAGVGEKVVGQTW